MLSTSYPIRSLKEGLASLKPPYPIIPLWKPKGISTHHLTRQCAHILKEKCAHTGVLDPFAQGVIVVLPAEHRFLKEQYTQGLKTYETQFLIGLQTDSLDLLGCVLSGPHSPPQTQSIHHLLNQSTKDLLLNFQKNQANFPQWLDQKPPLMSNIKVNGKRLQYWTRRGHTIEESSIPTRRVWLENLQVHSIRHLTLDQWLIPFLEELHTLSGEFRQNEVHNRWQAFLSMIPPHTLYPTLHCTLTVGKGFYIRSFIRDWCRSALNDSGCVLDLIRTQNAGFGYQECLNRL